MTRNSNASGKFKHIEISGTQDAIENQTLDEDKRLLAKEIDTLKRTLKAEARKSSGLEVDLQQIKSKWQTERVALENKASNLKSVIKEKSTLLSAQKEKHNKMQMKYQTTLRAVIQKMKAQLSNIRLKSTNEIDSMRNDIYKYVREMQSNFRNTLTEMYAKAQKNAHNPTMN